MKNIHALGLALLTVFAASAIASTTVFAASKLLLNGAEITSKIQAETSGELLLEDMKATGKPDLLCSAIDVGTIEPGGVSGHIEAELTLSGVLLEGSRAGADLIECEAHSTCTNPTDIELLNLPWLAEVGLIGSTFVGLISSGGSGEPEEVLDCNSIIGLLEDVCTPASFVGGILTNVAGGVMAELPETNEEINPPGNCTLGGANEGLQVGSGLITSPSGTLSVSE